jgi:hypothetical protein
MQGVATGTWLTAWGTPARAAPASAPAADEADAPERALLRRLARERLLAKELPFGRSDARDAAE